MRESIIGFLAAGLVLAVCAAPAATPKGEDPSRPPEWFVDHMNYLTQGTGRWIADNSQYKGDKEPFDAYGVEWTWGIGRKSLTGRLFGLRGGQEAGTFWQFRTFWHPAERKVYAQQFGGDGRVGLGTIEPAGAGRTKAVQEFFAPDGTRSVVGHESDESDPAKHVTVSFDVLEDGTWKKRRTYTWSLSQP